MDISSHGPIGCKLDALFCEYNGDFLVHMEE